MLIRGNSIPFKRVEFKRSFSPFYVMSLQKPVLLIFRNVISNLRVYRLLEIQNRLHNESFSKFLWPMFQYALLLIHCLACVVLIRAQSVNLPVHYYVMLVCMQVTVVYFEKNCFEADAKIYESSCKYRNELWKLNSKLFSKIVVSLSPIRIEYSSCHYFKSHTFIT